MPARPPPPDTCANCGAAIPRTARACPECGADERSGWRESSAGDGLDLPDSAYADDPEAAAAPSRPAHPVNWFWLAAGLLVLVVLVLATLRL
jgi:predicted nucleic acid-binding Zn ribbon protein